MAAVDFVGQEKQQDSDEPGQIGQEEPKFRKLLMATAAVSMLGATMGATLSFSGVVGPQLTVQNENVEKSNSNATFGEEDLLILSQSQFSWFASLIILGVIPSNMLAMVYVAEISSARWRGTMLSLGELFIAIGSLLTYILGSMFHWRILALLVTTLPIIPLASSWLILPESPVWLVHQGKIEEARKALQWFHPSLDSAEQELKTLMKSSSVTDKKSVDKREKNSKLSSLRDSLQSLKLLVDRKDVHHPLFLLSLLFLFQQLSGRTIIPFYAVDLLMDTATAFNEYVAAILFGLTSAIGQLLNTSLSPVLRRKGMLVISVVILAAAMVTLSIISMEPFQHEGNKGIRSILVLTAVLASGIGYHFGIGPVPWNLCNELYPSDVRLLLSGISQAYGLTLSFLVVKTFPALKSTFGLSWLFAFNGLSNAMALVFVLTLLPETKDVRLEQIASAFGKEAKKKGDDEEN